MTRTTDYAALAAAAPVNRQAALARDGHGVRYEAKIEPWQERWDAPPPQERRPAPDLPRLEGRTFGDGMRVLRYHGTRSNGARWLVRCRCGWFELRSTKAILTAQADHCCAACQYDKTQRRNYAADRADPDWRDARGQLLKFRISADEVRLVLARLTGEPDPAGISAGQRDDLIARLRDRISGLDPA